MTRFQRKDLDFCCLRGKMNGPFDFKGPTLGSEVATISEFLSCERHHGPFRKEKTEKQEASAQLAQL